jgi:Spy/CpxP family protein refolding chaperone
MAHDLQLTATQREQLVQLFEERRSRLAAFQQNVRAQFDQEHETLRTAIERILTPEQFERFEQEIRKRAPRRPPSPE